MNCSEAVILASGPSLTAEDCELVRQWREAKAGRAVFVTNTTFRAAPWADVLYAMDRKWWLVYGDEARASFAGKRVSPCDVRGGVERVHVAAGEHSGGGAMLYAMQCGARRLILLGFDGRPAPGKAHWHEDHPKTLGNCGSWKSWPNKMLKVTRRLRGVSIVNCSRSTVYTLWPRMPLEQALCGVRESAA